MYDPTIGRWISQDPIGFEAGDKNLYRYVENQTTRYIDPSGLDFAQPLGSPFLARAVFREPPAWNQGEVATVLNAYTDAGQRILKSVRMIRNWQAVTQQFQFIQIGNQAPFESATWRAIDTNMTWFRNKIETVYSKLMNPRTCIFTVNNRNETHPDGNPMYTTTINLGLVEFGAEIHLRSHFWTIGDTNRAFWTTHEFARYFLFMNDDTPTSPGVGRWDAYISWLVDKNGQMMPPPR